LHHFGIIELFDAQRYRDLKIDRPSVHLKRHANLAIPNLLMASLGLERRRLMSTNSVKYAKGNITVRIETSATAHSLSVTDDGDGSGLPAEFDPANGSGLGMKIVQSLVRQINGTLQSSPGAGGGTRFTVAFAPQP
jgi:signal transduction histidine kinase